MTDEPWGERLAGLEEETLDGGLTLISRAQLPPAPARPGPDDRRCRRATGCGSSRCNSIHTFGMRFALDLVWLGRDGRVLRVDHGVAPWRMKLCVRARSVVETAAGGGDAFAAALDGV